MDMFQSELSPMPIYLSNSEVTQKAESRKIEDEEKVLGQRNMHDPYAFINVLEDMKPMLLWCKEKAENSLSPLHQRPELANLFRYNTFLYFPTAVKFTRWLFQRRRGYVRPWCILLTGWREAQPCAAAMLAARTGDVRRLRADAKRPPLREIDYEEEDLPWDLPLQPPREYKTLGERREPMSSMSNFKDSKKGSTSGGSTCAETSSSETPSLDLPPSEVQIAIASMVVVPSVGHQEHLAHRWASGPGLETQVPTYVAATETQKHDTLRKLGQVTFAEHLNARFTLQHLSL